MLVSGFLTGAIRPSATRTSADAVATMAGHYPRISLRIPLRSRSVLQNHRLRQPVYSTELARLVTAVEVVPFALATNSGRADHVLVLAHVVPLSDWTLALLGEVLNASRRLYSRLALPVAAVNMELVLRHQC